MNENLYDFYLNILMEKSRNNPLYQYSLLMFYNQGILWDIELYKKQNLYTNLEISLLKETEKRVYIGIGGRKNTIIESLKPFLRTVNYFASIPPLLYYFPEIVPPLNQEIFEN